MATTVTLDGSASYPLLGGSSISWDLNDNQAKASLKWNANDAFVINHQDSVVVARDAVTIFTGRVRNFSKHKDGHSTGRWVVTADVLDHVSLMSDTQIKKAYNDTDQNIIIDIITTAGLSGSITATTATVDQVKTGIKIGFNGSVRDALDQIAALSGAVWHLSANATLNYNTAANAGQAPYHFVDRPATNAWTYSEELNNAAWTKSNASVSANATTAPNGTTTADKLIEDATAGVTHHIERTLVGATDDKSQTLSMYAKAAERTKITLWCGTKAGTFPNVMFNLSDGTVFATNSFAGDTITSAVSSAGSGWYRVSITVDIRSGGSTPTFFASLVNAANATTYTGDGTSGVLVWGFQYQSDSYAAGDYVYTSADARTGYGVMGLNVSSRFDQPANSVTVIGGRDANGKTVTELRTDSASITAYGTISKTVENENILSSAAAILYGDAYLALRANPEVTAGGSTRQNGIEVNQLIRVTNTDYWLLSREFLVTRVSLTQETASKSLWTFTLGRNTVQAERVLRLFTDQSRGLLPSEMLGVSFDGTNDYLDFTAADVPAAVDNLLACTISFWYVRRGTTTRRLIDKDGGWRVIQNSTGTGTGINFKRLTSGTEASWTNDTVIAANTVYHIVISWNGGTTASDCVILVNGAGTTSRDFSPSGSITNEGDTGLELARNHSTEYANAWMRDVCIWTQAMGTSDMSALMEDTSGDKTGGIFPVYQLVRLRLDDRTDGTTLGNDMIVDSWGSLANGDGSGGAAQSIEVYVP